MSVEIKAATGLQINQFLANRPIMMGNGQVAVQQQAPNGNVFLQPMQVANADNILPLDAWRNIDSNISVAQEEMLEITPNVRARGLVDSIPDAYGTMTLTTQKRNRTGEATLSMSGATRGATSDHKFGSDTVPIPIITVPVEVDARTLAVARRNGYAMDTALFEDAGIVIAQRIEDMMVNGSAIEYADASIYGMTNAPDSNVDTVGAPEKADGTESTTWKADSLIYKIIDMKDTLTKLEIRGSVSVYMSAAWDKFLDRDYAVSGASMISVRERLQKIMNVTFVSTTYLDNFDMVMVRDSKSTMRLLEGMKTMTTQEVSTNNSVSRFNVSAIYVPQFRSDIAERSGIVKAATVYPTA